MMLLRPIRYVYLVTHEVRVIFRSGYILGVVTKTCVELAD